MKFLKHTVVQGDNFSVYFEDSATPKKKNKPKKKKQVSFDDHFYQFNKIQQACIQDICKHSEEEIIPFTENEILECASSLNSNKSPDEFGFGFQNTWSMVFRF